MPTVSVVIPCLNESETLALCIQEAKKGIQSSSLQGEVVVADNGSTDGSQTIAEREGARVVHVPVRGYGAALHYGILSAKSDIVVFGDADMSYPFTSVPDLVKPILESKADMVLGSRLEGTIENKAMPFLNRHLGTPVLSFLIRTFFRLPTSDCNSGMRALRRSRYEEMNLLCPGMEYASEMLIRAAQKGFRYSEVPISFRKDQRTGRPHLRRWRDGWRHLRFILGNAPTSAVILTPAVLGVFMLAVAFVLSFNNLWYQDEVLHYHTAFLLIAAAMPLLLFTVSFMLVRAASHEAKIHRSRLVQRLHEFSENAAPFYIAMCFYALSALQGVWVAYKWWEAGFSNLSEIPSLIRLMVLAIIGTGIFSLDLGLGLLKLVPFSTKRKET